MKTILTTGEHLVEDVLMHFTCWECEGYGFHKAPSIEEEDSMCFECLGSGLSL